MKVTLADLTRHLEYLQRQGVSPEAEITFSVEEPEKEYDGQAAVLLAGKVKFLQEGPEGATELVSP